MLHQHLAFYSYEETLSAKAQGIQLCEMWLFRHGVALTMRHNKTISGQRDTTLVQFNVLDQLLYLRHIKEEDNCSSKVRGGSTPPPSHMPKQQTIRGGVPPPSYAKQQISIYGQNYGGGGYPPPYGQNYGRLRSHTDFWRSFNRSKIGLIFTPFFCNASRNTWGQQPEWLAWWKSSFGRMKRVWGSEVWG